MDSEDKKIIKETLELTRENNRLLKKMRRRQFWGTLTSVLYWIIVLGVSFGAYYFLQPYLEKMKELFLGFQEMSESIPSSTQTASGAVNSVLDFSEDVLGW